MADKTTEKQLGGATGKGFMPGQSGNPAGRPKDSFSLVTILKNKLKTMSPDGKRTAAEAFIENLIQDGLDGQDKARDIIMSFTEPKPATKLEVSDITEIKTDSKIFEDE